MCYRRGSPLTITLTLTLTLAFNLNLNLNLKPTLTLALVVEAVMRHLGERVRCSTLFVTHYHALNAVAATAEWAKAFIQNDNPKCAC